MAAIAPTPLAGGPSWDAVAAHAQSWLASCAVPARDAAVLLPFAALLAPAREAFARRGGWMPRVETPLTLAAALAPAPEPGPGQLAGERVLDRANAAALLRRQPWGEARARSDRRTFEQWVAAVVEAAQLLRDGAARQPPSRRERWWAACRERLPATTGPGAFESLLLRVALEWAAAGVAPATDVLFAHRPSAWIVVRLGGADELAEAVAAAGTAPVLCLDADAAAEGDGDPERWCCETAEDESFAAATLVIEALNAGRAPVALVALDRVGVRRTRALLERAGVALVDETGWTLSTTIAATSLMLRLRAAAPGADADTRLAWLKAWPPASATAGAVDALEARWRGGRVAAGDATAADVLLRRAQAELDALSSTGTAPLAVWLERLADRLSADGSLAAMRADAAGAQVLASLRLGGGGEAWRQASRALVLDLAGFTAWVDSTLEAAEFVPPAAPGAEVVLTPLARAIGRPFAQVVVPGADHAHLGRIEAVPSLVGEALAAACGLEHAARRHARQRLALRALMRQPALALLRRRRDGDEPLAPSPEVEAWALDRTQGGRPPPPERDWSPRRVRVASATAARPAPVIAGALPSTLSASTVEALRDCPYRFFARAVLRLFERDELDAEVGKRDYGDWLHAVLDRFHRERRDGADDARALADAADATTRASGLDAAELLPFRASFEAFAPAYLRWLADREAKGWHWQDGEAAREARPDALAPIVLSGRIDRLDRGPDGALQVIDYKTGNVQRLRQRVREPLEDTQLAFYAVLEPQARSAIYLALDDAEAPLAIAHEGVGDSAAALVAGLGGEMARLAAGAPLPALGEGEVCETCEARGLCRRDHWGAA